MYAISAVGVGAPEARMIHYKVIRHLRFIGHSPRHITRECNEALCARLHRPMPLPATWICILRTWLLLHTLTSSLLSTRQCLQDWKSSCLRQHRGCAVYASGDSKPHALKKHDGAHAGDDHSSKAGTPGLGHVSAPTAGNALADTPTLSTTSRKVPAYTSTAIAK